MQYAQLVIMAAEAVAVIAGARARASAERDQTKAAEITKQIATNHKVAAALWDPVLADQERNSLDVAQTLTAWAAAQAWKETDRAAARASTLAEDRLRDLRPAAMMRYGDLRSQGLDAVTAIRKVVPLLETDPRIGDPSLRAGALAASAASTELEDPDGLDATRAADLDAGRLSGTAGTRVLAEELDAERAGHEPPHGLAGYELAYGVTDRRANDPHLGSDGRAVDDLHEGLATSTTAQEPVGTNPWAGSSSGFDALGPVDVEAVTALLVSESALLTEIETHRTAAAQQERLAATERTTVRELAATHDDLQTPLVDEHTQALSATDRHLSVVTDASVHVAFDRSAKQALTASFPPAVTEVPASVVASVTNAPVTAAQAASVTKQAPKPMFVRS
ncbi:hypothetical protein acdb102_21590 [Acidothermaceae bacterium B102]|nr:hypothetical protein acdb102_21590 [Acidothermaceae bacterium B102]